VPQSVGVDHGVRETRERDDEWRIVVVAARGVGAHRRGGDDRLHAMFAYEFERDTTEERLVGAGTDG
jgi:hypothetical protein